MESRPVSSSPDTSHRIHIAANDPAFPAKRAAATATILAAIDSCALAAGFTAKPQSWAKSGPNGTVSIRLKRDAYGWDCTISFGFQPITGTATGIWADEDEVPLGQFYGVDDGKNAGVITYLDVFENPACLAAPLHILTTRALPWLDAHHTAVTVPDIERYRSRGSTAKTPQ